MTSRLLVAATLLFPGVAMAACPEFLDHDMRKLHSKEQVNLCKVQADRPMLIINTASHCGYTGQFKGLEALHQRYGDDLAVVGFASNDFRQEAKDEETAAEVCYVNYGVTFTMVAPSEVTGDNANPVFQAINSQSQAPSWNFNKYLIAPDGQSVKHYGSMVKPTGSSLEQDIVQLLKN